MRLIFAYAIKYRNFKDQAFTLVNSYHIQLRGGPGGWDGISIQKVDAFQQHLPPNILSISAIVGRNATGKTNFVEMIGAEYRPPDYGGDCDDAFFLLYAPNEDDGRHYYFEVVSPDSFGTLFSCIRPAPEGKDSPRFAEGWCSYDRSSGRLLAAEAQDRGEGKTVMFSLSDRFQYDGMTKKHGFSVQRNVRMYRAGTFSSQVQVVQKLYRNEDRTVLRDPRYSLKVICNTRFLEHGPEGTPYEDTPLFPPLYTREDVPEDKRDAVRLAESWVKFYAESQAPDFELWDTIRCMLEQLGRENSPPGMPGPFTSGGVYKEEQVLEALSHCVSVINEELELMQIGVIRSEDFLDAILTSKILHRTESGFTIPVAPEPGPGGDVPRLTRILVDDIFRLNKRAGEFLQPMWENISDGELWYIHFLASISEALETAESAEDLDTCIMVLDEPEIHMHPDLARQLLDQLTCWLKDYTSKKVQIILTTHSPFILSDIEKGNVQVLKRSGADAEAEYWSKVASPEKQTFAANIYALLTDSFFLDSGFGEIARKQIKAVLQELNSTDNVLETGEHISATIGSVGEQLVRRKLEELYQRRLNAHPKEGQEVAQ